MEKEEWKLIAGSKGYCVSNYGRIKKLTCKKWNKVNNGWSVYKEHIIVTNHCNTKGYERVPIYYKNGTKVTEAVHRLVAIYFKVNPNPSKFNQVNHLDGNKLNNYWKNLQWCNNSMNQKHAIKHELKSRKVMSLNCHLRKLSEEDVEDIISSYSLVDTSIRGNKMKFCREMKLKYKLKSANTILWILQGGTHKFHNQDIVQTTNR